MKEHRKYFYFASAFAVMFFCLGYLVTFHSKAIVFENTFQRVFRGDLPMGLTRFFLFITRFGNPLSLILMTIALMILFYVKKEKAASLYVGLNSILGAGLLNALVKQVFQRPRPKILHLVTERSYSFPSGHAMGSMIFFGSLFFLVSLLTTDKNTQIFVKVMAGLFIFLIGLSRIYLGVHYPSDIIGGYLLGLVWLCGTFPLYERLNERLRLKSSLKSSGKKVKK